MPARRGCSPWRRRRGHRRRAVRLRERRGRCCGLRLLTGVRGRFSGRLASHPEGRSLLDLGERADDPPDPVLPAADAAHGGGPVGRQGLGCVHRDAGDDRRLRLLPAPVPRPLGAVHVQHDRGRVALQVHPLLSARGPVHPDDLEAEAARGLQPGLGGGAPRALLVVRAVLRRARRGPAGDLQQSGTPRLHRACFPGLLAAADPPRRLAGLQERHAPRLLRGHLARADAAAALPLGLPAGRLQRGPLPPAARLTEHVLLHGGGHDPGGAGGHDGLAAAAGASLVRAVALHALGLQLPPWIKDRTRNRLRHLHERDRR
mmetsp:Transcript_16884/g.49377  ORF Transcript_16884/g.49377 Transcript_16884/m.49377 type:complete len:317 (+) Transcript_16884:411-1361(+)